MSRTDLGYQLRSTDTWRDPWSSYQWLRDNDPVHRIDHPEYGRFWALTRFDDVFAAVRDHERFASGQGLTPDRDSGMMFDDGTAPIVMMDPPNHTLMRRLVSRPMTPRAVAPIEPSIVEFVDERLAQMVDTCDIIDLLFKPLPSFVVAHFLGVPDADRSQFDGWSSAIVAANANADIASATDAALGLFSYSEQLIERRRIDPGDDLVSDLVSMTDNPVSPQWIVGFIFTMVTGGNDTMTGLLGGTAELLTDRRDQRQLLLDDPTLIRSSIDELLRLTSPVQNLGRTTTCDVQIGEVTIPEGDKVMLVYGSANRDPRRFGDDAADLDVHRNIETSLALGYGTHHCLGAAAARLAGAIAIERLLDRFPDFAVDAAAGTFAAGPFVRRYESLPFIANS